ncbi:MAG: hypothetical protein Fur007_00580 [Rhodoferax sp.]
MMLQPDFSPVKPVLLRLVTLLLGLGVGASALYWVLRWPQAQPPLRAQGIEREPLAPDSAAVARLLTGPEVLSGPAASPAALPLQLKGVIAVGGHGRGVALIAPKPGAPAKLYRVGQTVDDAWVLQSVQARSARVGPPGDDKASVTLELPTPGVRP